MNEYPPVSCMCLTYGRPHVLEEAIESFLKQDYKGEKELIILNDFDKQVLIYEHPEIKIININQRFHSVGEKRSATASLSSHDILFVWDDDDLFLPHRISFTINMMKNEKYYYFFKPSKAFTLNDGIIKGPVSNLFHSGSSWRRELFDAVRGYAHMGSGQDLEIEKAFEKYDKTKKYNYNNIKLKEIYYIYRWSGTETFHLSGFGKDEKDKKTGNQKVKEYVEKKIKQNEVQLGNIKLQPHWKINYKKIVDKYIKRIK